MNEQTPQLNFKKITTQSFIASITYGLLAYASTHNWNTAGGLALTSLFSHAVTSSSNPTL